MKARPDIDEKVTQLVSKGRWMVPGYKVFESLFGAEAKDANNCCRRNLETSQFFRASSVVSSPLCAILVLQA